MSPAARRLYTFARTVHIYLTVVGLSVLLFFAGTGVMLNHPDWFGIDTVHYSDLTGVVPAGLLDPVDDLGVVEHLRSAYDVRGAVDRFDIDDAELRITFRRPGHYLADAVVARPSGELMLTIEQHGVAALLADLHRGSETGWVWRVAIVDAAAALLVIASLTGFLMLVILPRYRRHCLIGLVASTAMGWLVYVLAVP